MSGSWKAKQFKEGPGLNKEMKFKRESGGAALTRGVNGVLGVQWGRPQARTWRATEGARTTCGQL